MMFKLNLTKKDLIRLEKWLKEMQNNKEFSPSTIDIKLATNIRSMGDFIELDIDELRCLDKWKKLLNDKLSDEDTGIIAELDRHIVMLIMCDVI